MIETTISDLADEEGWVSLGDLGSLLQKKQPNFDSRNYGFPKLSRMIGSISKFEIEQKGKPQRKNETDLCSNQRVIPLSNLSIENQIINILLLKNLPFTNLTLITRSRKSVDSFIKLIEKYG